MGLAEVPLRHRWCLRPPWPLGSGDALVNDADVHVLYQNLVETLTLPSVYTSVLQEGFVLYLSLTPDVLAARM
jgi:hypothetical protein